MCGIVGFFETYFDVDVASLVLRSMADRLGHRGPDDAGVWLDGSAGVALAHRRLSILDLSRAGHQPMVSSSGRWVIVLNGEIYNHRELRQKLESAGKAPIWRGHSDTETLLTCVQAWGVTAALQSTVGMFALALWDRQTRTLTLARDRLGEKPLYYGFQDGTLLFGSELKALKAHPVFRGKIDRDALALFLRHNAVPAPYSIYEGIQKLPPGHLIRLPFGSRPELAKNAQPEPYWQLGHAISMGRAEPFAGTPDEAVDHLESLLGGAIEGQMLSDVPLGAFLSGGVDSSTVVALMQARSTRPVKTFTIGFQDASYNEAGHAKAVAQYLGTNHTELYVSANDALAMIPKLPEIWCEPFSDSSQIPTLILSQLARREVTVVLSGDGGDESFGGYSRHFVAPDLWNWVGWLPLSVRRVAAALLGGPNEDTWNRFYQLLNPLLPKRVHMSGAGFKLHKLAEVLVASDQYALYKQLASDWEAPADVVLGGSEPKTWLDRREVWADSDGFAHWMMAMDTLTYLPDDILTKVDRAAMSVSLETRLPFLDHRVVEFAWSLPLHIKIRNGQGKWALRQVLYRHVPKALIERPKQGFGIPIACWLRGPLRDWAEALLDESRLKRQGFFNPAPIRQKWAEHRSGQRNWPDHLWNVLMFQAWLEMNSMQD